MKNQGLTVGAGRAAIPFTDEMLPNVGELYTHIHDETYIQCLSLQAGEKLVFLAIGLVGASCKDQIREAACEIFGVKPQQVIFHGKHVLSTPHIGSPGNTPMTPESIMEKSIRMEGQPITREEAEIFLKHEQQLAQAVVDGAVAAMRQARDSEQPAKAGFGMGYSEANVNRVVHTAKGWWQGHNPDGITDRSMPVIRFDDMSGKPIAIIFNVNTAPGVLEKSFLSDGRRALSGDIAAAAERWVDAQYPGCVSIYTTGATGDQWQSLRALQDRLEKDGTQTVTDLGEQGFILTEILGEHLGEQVVKAAEKIKTAEFNGQLRFGRYEDEYPGQKASVKENAGPVTQCEFLPTPPVTAGCDILTMGDTAVLFISVEMCVTPYKMIKESSPYKNTFVIEFANDKGGGYMVEKELYEKLTYQSRKSRFAAGSAELFAQRVCGYLTDIKEKASAAE